VVIETRKKYPDGPTRITGNGIINKCFFKAETADVVIEMRVK
jgi:hypothetical protein